MWRPDGVLGRLWFRGRGRGRGCTGGDFSVRNGGGASSTGGGSEAYVCDAGARTAMGYFFFAVVGCFCAVV